LPVLMLEKAEIARRALAAQLEGAGVAAEAVRDMGEARAAIARAAATGRPFAVALLDEDAMRAADAAAELRVGAAGAMKRVLLVPLGASSGAYPGYDAVLTRPVRQRELVPCLWRLAAPDSYAAAHSGHGDATAETVQASGRILLVDDNETNRLFATTLL